tara:strand:- start:338 stop:454 length:117 start_codon:yes stop_codon:yes gene_type:complete
VVPTTHSHKETVLVVASFDDTMMMNDQEEKDKDEQLSV